MGDNFIGCTTCYKRKKDCKCKIYDFHKITLHHFQRENFKMVEKCCGKEISTSRTNRNDAVHCGDVFDSEIQFCSECSYLTDSGGKGK